MYRRDVRRGRGSALQYDVTLSQYATYNVDALERQDAESVQDASIIPDQIG